MAKNVNCLILSLNMPQVSLNIPQASLNMRRGGSGSGLGSGFPNAVFPYQYIYQLLIKITPPFVSSTFF